MKFSLKRLIEPLLLIALAVTVIAFGVRSWKSYHVSKGEDSEETGGETVTEGAAFSDITYGSEAFSLSFHYGEDGKWYWLESEEYPLDSKYISAIADALTGFAPALVNSSPTEKELETYGFDAPAYFVNATRGDGSLLAFEVGKATEEGSYYIRYTGDEENDSVFLTNSSFVPYLAYDIYDMYRLEKLPVLDLNNMKTVTVEGKSTQTYTVKAVGSGEDAEMAWFRGAEDMRGNETTEAMSQDLQNLALDACVIWNPLSETRKLCGFSEPAATVTVEYLSGEETTQLVLTVGKAIDDTHRYVMLGGSTTIYSMETSCLDAILTIAGK